MAQMTHLDHSKMIKGAACPDPLWGRVCFHYLLIFEIIFLLLLILNFHLETMSNIMNDICTGLIFEDPERTIQVNKIADYFVDDTSTGVNIHAINDDKSVLEHLHDTEQTHAHILFSAGHKLALDKCSYYIADFKHRGTKYYYQSINDLPGELNLQESFSPDTVTVPRLQPSQAYKTLAKMRTWTNKIKTSALLGYDRVEAYHSNIEKSMIYMISSSSLTYTQCKK